MQDIIGDLPDCHQVNFMKDFNNRSFDLFIQAVGFENRTVGIAAQLSKLPNFKVSEAILIRYNTNIEDNVFYEEMLLNYINRFTEKIIFFTFDEQISSTINHKLNYLKNNQPLNILVDISSFSSGLILSLIRILLFSNNNIYIVYTEGEIYHPTDTEFEIILDEKHDNHSLYQTKGIEHVKISPDYNGGTKENQDLVISFPSFRAERTYSIIAFIDDLILKHRERNRIIWIIGEPHMDEIISEKRMSIQKQLNRISSEDKVYSVSTLDYKKTLITLDHIYNELFSKYHINISDLGSKMQSLGIALFANLRRDVTVFYAEPKKYNPAHYSDGIKDYWAIDFGNTQQLLDRLFRVDLIEELL